MSGEVSTNKRSREETGVEASAMDNGSEVFAGANNKMRKKTRSKQKNMRKDTYAVIFVLVDFKIISGFPFVMLVTRTHLIAGGQ
jgi:hypothetical protein